MTRRKATLLDVLFVPSTGINRRRPPAAQYGCGKKVRVTAPFVDKPYRGCRRCRWERTSTLSSMWTTTPDTSTDCFNRWITVAYHSQITSATMP